MAETAAPSLLSARPGCHYLAGSHRSVDNAIIIVVLWANVQTQVEGNCNVRVQVETSVPRARAFRQVVVERADLPPSSHHLQRRLRAGARHLPRILGRFLFASAEFLKTSASCSNG